MVFDHGGNVVAIDQKEHAQIYPRPGWVEHDPAEIWARCGEVTRGALSKARIGAGSIVVIDYQQANGGTGGGLVAVALAHGLALGVLVSAFGAVSGGHFNPAVTFGVWIAGRIDGRRAVGYVVAQLVGSVVAGLALRAVFADQVWQASNLGTPALGPGVGVATGTPARSPRASS